VLWPAQQALAFTDVPSSYWDYSQITYVTPWMSDYGSSVFKPTAAETRSYVPRVLQLHGRLKDEFDKGMQLQLDAMHRDGQREGKTLVGPPRNRPLR